MAKNINLLNIQKPIFMKNTQIASKSTLTRIALNFFIAPPVKTFAPQLPPRVSNPGAATAVRAD